MNRRRHNPAVGPRVWVPAFLVSAALHAALLYTGVQWAVTSGPAAGKVSGPGGVHAVLGFALAWSLLAGIWSAMVANLLSKPSNAYGGIRGARLASIVLGLTLALDVLNSPCLMACPPTGLIVPILSFVYLYNTAMPPPPDDLMPIG